MRYHDQVGFIPGIQEWLLMSLFSCLTWYSPFLPRDIRVGRWMLARESQIHQETWFRELLWDASNFNSVLSTHRKGENAMASIKPFYLNLEYDITFILFLYNLESKVTFKICLTLILILVCKFCTHSSYLTIKDGEERCQDCWMKSRCKY